MAAGLGFKDFTTGEVLTAADVDGYLMQGVWVFASAAARDAAVTSPQEGNFAYLKDTNVTTYYTGSAWANLDTTGMTNPMTTTGDTIYSSSGSTPARLGIGSTGQVLTVSGGLPSWATPASGGGMTLISTTTLSGASTTITFDGTGYNAVLFEWYGVNLSTADGFVFRPNDASDLATYRFIGNTSTSVNNYANVNTTIAANQGDGIKGGVTNNYGWLQIVNVQSTSLVKPFTHFFTWQHSSAGSTNEPASGFQAGGVRTTTAITSMKIATNTGGVTFNAGTVKLWGIK